ncbi:DsrE family protein [Peptococcaceae bacterium]|nr:DsrE family protein [Peptococcaceae bacterium]
MDKLKAIFHVNETANWQKTLTNINNFVKDAGISNANIKILANGSAVNIFKDDCPTSSSCGCGSTKTTSIPQQISELAQIGIEIAVCRNALKAHDLAENKLPSFVTVVPAGITELVEKQHQGYAYIKP